VNNSLTGSYPNRGRAWVIPAGVVVGQVSVGAKTNEIPMLARQTIRDRGGHYILTVKGN
jgi:hypothetical protein